MESFILSQRLIDGFSWLKLSIARYSRHYRSFLEANRAEHQRKKRKRGICKGWIKWLTLRRSRNSWKRSFSKKYSLLPFVTCKRVVDRSLNSPESLFFQHSTYYNFSDFVKFPKIVKCNLLQSYKSFETFLIWKF